MPAGRPSDYDPQVAADICAAISTCTNSLESILSTDERFPSHSAFYRWMINHAELREMYARAKDEQLQILADEIQIRPAPGLAQYTADSAKNSPGQPKRIDNDLPK